MQVRTGGIAGRSYFRNGLSLFYRLAFRCQELGTVHIYGVYTAAMTDHDVISRGIAVGRYHNRAGCCCRDGRSGGCRDIDSLMIAGRSFCRRGSASETGRNASAGRTRPLKANIPKTGNIIRSGFICSRNFLSCCFCFFAGFLFCLAGRFRFLALLFFLAPDFCLDLLDLVLLRRQIRVVLVYLALGCINLTGIALHFLIFLGTQRLD